MVNWEFPPSYSPACRRRCPYSGVRASQMHGEQHFPTQGQPHQRDSLGWNSVGYSDDSVPHAAIFR